MIIALFVFAVMFLLCAVGTIVSIIIDTDDGVVLCGGIGLIVGSAMSIMAIVQFAVEM